MIESISILAESAKKAFNNQDFQAAADGFRECLTYFEGTGDLAEKAEIQNNLGVVLLELKDPEGALCVLEGTDLVFAEAGDKKRQAMALGNIAAALQDLERYPEALSSFEQAAEMFKEIGEKPMRSVILKKVSDLQLKTGKQYQALASLNTSLELKEKKTGEEKMLKGVLGKVINKLTGH